MMQLSFAYLFAAGLISLLFLLARRNRKLGWRRQRGVWLQMQAEAALRTVQARPAGAPAQQLDGFSHLGDLGRLQESLVAHGAPQAPAPVEKPLKSNVLA
jgi:hypothetical protein